MTIDPEELRRAWEYHKEADMLFAARFNYSMVAQSMLLVSFATLLIPEIPSPYILWAQLVIGLFGIWYTWNHHLLSRSLVAKMNLLKGDYLEKHDPIYKSYMAAKPSRPSGIQTKRIPLALGIVWALLLIISIAKFAAN